MQQLHDEMVRPIATGVTKGAWYRGLRLVSLDGSTLDIADQAANEAAFGRPGSSCGSSALPQLRFVSLVESGTHVLFGSQMAPYAASETALARQVLQAGLAQGMLCLADRHFFGFDLWTLARSTGGNLLWRIKRNARLDCDERLPDGSYLSRIFPTERDRRHASNSVRLRVIDYRLADVEGAEPLYRLITTLLDPQQAPAAELAALYHERSDIETGAIALPPSEEDRRA